MGARGFRSAPLTAVVLSLALGAAAQEWQPASVTVTLLDAGGSPAADVPVTCVTPGFRGELSGGSRSATTDQNGRCTFTDVDGDPGACFYLIASAGDQGVAERIDPLPGGQMEATLRLRGTWRIAGVVRDQFGQPIERAQVMLWAAWPLATTDAEGRFALLLPDEAPVYDWWLYKPGYSAMPVQINEDEGFHDLVLWPGTSISGTMTWPDGSPAAGVEVTCADIPAITDADGRFSIPPIHRGRGTVEARAHATREGKEHHGRLQFEHPSAQSGSVALQLQEIQPIPGLDVQWAPGLMFGAGINGPSQPAGRQVIVDQRVPALTVKGRVTRGDTREPVRGKVLLFTHPDVPSAIECGETDERGEFIVQGIQEHRAALYILSEDPTLYPIGGPVELPAPGEAREHEVAISMTPGCAIFGKVVYSDGKTVPNALLHLEPAPLYASTAHADQSGHFQFGHLETAGSSMTLRTGYPITGTTAQKALGTVEAGEMREGVVLELPKPSPTLSEASTPYAPKLRYVRGTVTDPNGQPLASYFVRVASASRPDLILSGSTNDLGQFRVAYRSELPKDLEIQEVMLGRRIWTSPSMQSGVWETALIRSERQLRFDNDTDDGVAGATIVVEPPHPLYIIGHISDVEGNPVPGVRVQLIGQSGSPHSVHAGQGSGFVEQRPPDGPFLIEVTAPGYQACVLGSDRDFSLPHDNLLVQLRRGPFPQGISVFAAVTGRHPTDEEMRAMPGGPYVVERLEEYRRLAGQPSARAEQ